MKKTGTNIEGTATASTKHQDGGFNRRATDGPTPATEWQNRIQAQ